MTKQIQDMKQNAALAALEYIQEGQVVGIGSGSTVNIFIEQLAGIKHKIAGAVASSTASEQLLKSFNIPIINFNSIDQLPIYIDGADAFNEFKQLQKGAHGCLVREKILAYAAEKFICIVDATKNTSILGTVPVPIEVIPMARSIVARNIVKLGGRPEYRENFISDNGNIILDIYGLTVNRPIQIEQELKQITGVIDSGIFAKRPADFIIIGNTNTVSTL